MTQPSRVFTLWQRLYTRFSIEPLPAGDVDAPGVSTTIVPVTISDDLLLAWGCQQADTAGSDSSGQKNGLTVPSGKRWRVHAIHSLRVSGLRNIDQFIIRDNDLALNMPVHIFTAATQEALILATPLTMDEDDRIDLNYVGGSGSTVYTVQAWVSEEDAF